MIIGVGAPLEGHTRTVTALAVHDGLLYSSANDCTVRLWDGPQLLMTLAEGVDPFGSLSVLRDRIVIVPPCSQQQPHAAHPPTHPPPRRPILIAQGRPAAPISGALAARMPRRACSMACAPVPAQGCRAHHRRASLSLGAPLTRRDCIVSTVAAHTLTPTLTLTTDPDPDPDHSP